MKVSHAVFICVVVLTASWYLLDLPKGSKKKLKEILADHAGEYEQLTQAEKDELVVELMKDKEAEAISTELSSRGRLKVLYSVLAKIEKWVSCMAL